MSEEECKAYEEQLQRQIALEALPVETLQGMLDARPASPHQTPEEAAAFRQEWDLILRAMTFKRA